MLSNDTHKLIEFWKLETLFHRNSDSQIVTINFTLKNASDRVILNFKKKFDIDKNFSALNIDLND